MNVSKNLQDPKALRIIAEYKRLADLWRLDARFREAYRRDPEKAIAETGLAITPEAFRLHAFPEEAQRRIRALGEGTCTDPLPDSYRLYRAALREVHERYKEIVETRSVPDEPCLRAWRERQLRRCRLQFGTAAKNMMEAPLMFELSEGCSVGCPFCGAAAKGLRGIFRYTQENAALWRNVLGRMHALIGDAAGYGTCYYATEGLDDPDYEKFLDDWYREFGFVPSTTTAVPLRDIERTRTLLRVNGEKGCYISRFSVLSPAMRDTLFTAFTPEELLWVALLPQFPEAPGNHFVRAGRNLGPDDPAAPGGTIACTSGFIVNMQEKTVRLVTPSVSDRDHPTGEWVLETCTFATAADLEAQIVRMIRQYMPEKPDLKKRFFASCDFSLKEKEGKVTAAIGGREKVLQAGVVGQEHLDRLSAALKMRKYTGSELLELLSEKTDTLVSFLLLNLLWHNGLIDQSA